MLRQQVPAAQNMSLAADSSPIFEVLNVAWAGEITGHGGPHSIWHSGFAGKTQQGAFTHSPYGQRAMKRQNDIKMIYCRP